MRQESTSDQLLLRVWPEICRHTEIHEATANVAALLATELHFRAVIVRRVNVAASCLESVAIGVPGAGTRVDLDRTPCDPEQLASFMAWCAGGGVVHRGRAQIPADLQGLLPRNMRGDMLVGPLRTDGQPTGMLILVGAPHRPLGDADERLFASLLEPFSVALENDRRLHEIAQLREAAEADRRALLTKLGRTDVTAPIVGAEAGLRPVMERVATVAGSDVPVLLFGDTGTGKEVIARAIHTHSPRAAGPFIRVNCGAIPPELLDSQLFGHEKGSFTGATDLRKGWFERADGGTLFLDEIGDLPLAAQVRLLRVLQDGCLERVGGQHPVHVDVRVVGATHRDLAAMVRAGTFREDLWYRLAVFPVRIPPLRDRLDDIAPLARHFAEKAATRFGLALALPSSDDIRLLLAYSWPGNVRELAAVIDRAALLGNGRRLEIATALGAVPSLGAALPPGGDRSLTAGLHSGASAAARNRNEFVSGPPGSGSAAGVDGRGSTDGVTPGWSPTHTDGSLETAMRVHIEAALRDAHGRIEGPFGAAARLAINPHTLRSRMRRLQIDWRAFRQ